MLMLKIDLEITWKIDQKCIPTIFHITSSLGFVPQKNIFSLKKFETCKEVVFRQCILCCLFFRLYLFIDDGSTPRVIGLNARKYINGKLWHYLFSMDNLSMFGVRLFLLTFISFLQTLIMFTTIHSRFDNYNQICHIFCFIY